MPAADYLNPLTFVVTLRPIHVRLAVNVVFVCALLAQATAQTTAPGSVDIGKHSPDVPLKVGGMVKPPRAIFTPDPEYSSQANHARLQGTLLLRVIVGPEGRARDIRVQRGLGMGLDEKAIEAVQRWKFEPATKDGKPVTVQINIEMNFRLYGTPAEDDFGGLVARADAGDTKSQLKLGRALLTGEGLPKNELEGLSWLQRAANRDVAEAQFRMAEYLYSHASNPSDYSVAYIWCYRAQHNRYKRADKMLEKIATKLSPSNLADAEIRAQQEIATANSR